MSGRSDESSGAERSAEADPQADGAEALTEHLSVVMPVYNERHLVGEAIDRVLRLESPRIRALQLIVVDDGSSDGTRELLQERVAARPGEFQLLLHDRNRGKGAAVRTGIEAAVGSVTIIHDADLEYDPQDIPRMLVPFQRDADAVFGSRFLAYDYRRVLYFRHAIGNRLLTLLAGLITDLNLTDMETCYKAVRTDLLRSIPIRSNDFRIEPELTIKLAKRGARIFEVPISYAGRTYSEGKKIGFRDALLALVAMLRWWLIDDLYRADQYGSNILVDLASVPHFNRWMAEALAPHLGARVLEVGGGIANLTRQFIPRDLYTVSDVNPHYLDFQRNFAAGKPYMEVRRIDLAREEDFEPLAGRYDTVVCVNVLEHLPDEGGALRNLARALEPGGRAVVLVPQNPELYGTLDEVLEHVKRYTREDLREALEKQGFAVERIDDFNRVTTPAWWLNGKLLRRRHMSRLQLKGMNLLTPLLRRIDRFLPWHGASLVAVARLPEAAGAGGAAPGPR